MMIQTTDLFQRKHCDYACSMNVVEANGCVDLHWKIEMTEICQILFFLYKHAQNSMDARCLKEI